MTPEGRPATDHIALMPLMKVASKCPALGATTMMVRSITSKMAAGMDLMQKVLSTVTTPTTPTDMKITQGLTNLRDITGEYAISHKQG